MKELELFQTYNGITKKYIVMAVTIQDLLNDPKYKDNKSLLLLAKPDVVPPSKPRKHKKSRLDRMEEKLGLLEEKLDLMEEKLDLILKRLDQHEQLFKAHGWIK